MSTFKFVDYFCKKYNVWVCRDKTIEFCPCRFKLRSVNFCNFPQYIIELAEEKGSPKFNKFVSLICKDLKHRVEGTDQRSLEIHHRLAKVVKDMEMGEIKPGDIVYCSSVGKDVIFYEYPDRKHFDTYYEHKVFPVGAKYKTFDGDIGTAPIACFSKISKGNFVAEYDLKEKGNDVERRLEHLKRLARQEGFKVDKIETKKGYKLIFFGDSQQELDDFLHLYCQ